MAETCFIQFYISFFQVPEQGKKINKYVGKNKSSLKMISWSILIVIHREKIQQLYDNDSYLLVT